MRDALLEAIADRLPADSIRLGQELKDVRQSAEKACLGRV